MTDEVAKEIAQKGFSLTIRGAKLTGKLLFKLVKGALNKLFINNYKELKAEAKEDEKIKRREIDKLAREKKANPKGKQSIKKLQEKGGGLSSLDLNDADLKSFDKTLKKYHVDYSIVTDKSTNPPTHTLFFKGNEVDAITKAFSEYSNRMIAKEAEKQLEKEGKALLRGNNFSEKDINTNHELNNEILLDTAINKDIEKLEKRNHSAEKSADTVQNSKFDKSAKEPVKERKSAKELLRINKQKIKVASVKQQKAKLNTKTPSEPSR